MDSNPEDTQSTRFLSFWIGLAVFLVFAVIAVAARPLVDRGGEDPSLDGGALAAKRLATKQEVTAAQTAQTTEYAWVDREKGLVRVPVARGMELALDSLKASKPRKTEQVIPGTKTAQEIFEKEQAAKAAAEAAAPAPADGAPAARKIVIKAVPNMMQYDTKTFEVTAGEAIVISFQNPDLLQHNLLICAPGSKDKVGNASNLMAADPTALEKQYIPDMPEILFHTPLVNPNAAYDLEFTAPAEPGDYPYVCTFPGHWILMNGVMKVLPAAQ